MGKFISKFTNSKPHSSTRNSENYQADLDGIQVNRLSSKSSKMNVGKILNEENNFADFEDILHATCALNTTCLFGLSNYSVQLFDYARNKKLKNWKGHEKDVTKCLYLSKIDRYLSCSRDKSIKLWSVTSEQCQLNMVAHELVVTGITSNPENTYLISGSRDNNINLWDLKTGKLLSTAYISRNLITDVCWSNDGRLLIQSSEDKEVRIWDPYNLKVIYTFPKKQYLQSSCHLSNDNNYAISTSNGFQGNGCEITLWDLRNRKIVGELFGHEQTVTSAKIIQNGNFIASCSNDSTVRLWDYNTLKPLESLYLGGTLTSVSESSRNLIVSSLSTGLFSLSV